MANKRMFAMTIIDSDAFLDMPLSTQALYFHLSMRADDEGFLNNAKKIQRTIGANQNDYDLLVAKSFIIEFEDGICVVKHWRINNYLRKDRFTPTNYKEERAMLGVKENGAYTLDSSAPRLPKPQEEPEASEEPVEVDEDVSGSIEGIEEKEPETKRTKPQKHKYGEYAHVLLTDEELGKLKGEYGEPETAAAIKFLDEYIEMKGYKAKSHYLCMRKWVYTAVKEYRVKQNSRPGVKKNSFCDYHQRDYDYEALEKMLLSN